MVRTYAWLVILGNKGPVSALYAVAAVGCAFAWRQRVRIFQPPYPRGVFSFPWKP